MKLSLDDDRRRLLIANVRSFFLDEFDEEVSEFRAERILEHMLESVGPEIYNQAVQDARAYMQEKIDDLDGVVYLEP
ncbi:MAG: DUF2164 domain-containing protein [Myxococcota bacterium]